jgi:hypothetical protein
VANFISRLTSNEMEPPIKYYFLNEHMFVIYTNSPWFVDIDNYLVAGRLPQHISLKE